MDKNAGLEGTVFGGSCVALVIQNNQKESDIKVPNYAWAWRKNKYDEFVDFAGQKEESERVIKDVLSGKLKIAYFKEFPEKQKKWINILATYKEKSLPKIKDLSDKEFVEEFGRFMDMYGRYFGLSAISFVYEVYIAETLAEEMSSIKDADEYVFAYIDETNKDFKSFMILYEEDLQKLANNKTTMQELLERFYYVKANYVDSQPLSEEQVNEDLKSLKKKKADHRKIPKKQLDGFLSGLNKRQRAMLDILAYTLPIRDLRKELNQIGQYVMFRFFDEALRRKGLETKRSFYLKMNYPEMKDLFEDPEKLGGKLEKRKAFSMQCKKGEIQFYEYYAFKAKEVAHTDTLKGVVASKGKVEGTARVIIGPSDFKTFKKGEVLVTESTRPDFVPIMKIAKAIIAEEGGITSHAAIVSRELGIPCLVGVSHATTIIKNGETLEVDTDQGHVRRV